MKKWVLFMMISMFALTSTAWAESEKSDQFIVINKSMNELAFYEDGRMVHTYSVATGASAVSTPEGEFKVIVKWECPVYYKTKTGGCVPGNPLGPRWIGLDVPKTVGYTYGIHGNASEWSIGTYASAGCVRMHNWQVTELYEMVKMDTPVVIIRSKETFDKIAENHGYAIKKAETVSEDITIFGETPTYYGAHKGTLNKKTLSKQKIKVTEKIDGWFKTNVGGEIYWLFTENYVVGDIETKEKYFMMPESHKIYSAPKDSAGSVKTEKPIVFHSPEQVGEWQYVQYGTNKNGWLQIKDAEEVTREDWILQEKMPDYTNKLLNELNNLSTDADLFWSFAKNTFL